MSTAQPTVPYGYCQCGCGRKTEASKYTSAAHGWIKGQPRKHVRGHNRLTVVPSSSEVEAHRRLWAIAGSDYGLCLCGCGERTTLAPDTKRRLLQVRGEPVRYVRGHGNRLLPIYVEEDRGFTTPCWIRTGHLTADGYARMMDARGRQRPAHVVAWEKTHGPVPGGLQVDHLCRQRACIRIEHLEVVTGAENSRRSRGTKLSQGQVGEIRLLIAEGLTQASIAKQFGVTLGAISHIATGRNWRE